MPKMFNDSTQNSKAKARLVKERKLTIALMSFVASFTISWMPYSIVCLYVAFWDTDIPPLLGTLPAIFAKSSMLWSSLFYLFTNNQFRRKLNFNLLTFGTRHQEAELTLTRTIFLNNPNQRMFYRNSVSTQNY
jgi:hypothetical protein